MTDLTIIIVTYNPGTILLDCLGSLSAGLGEHSSEVFIVDNASTDGFVQRAMQQFPTCRFILNTDNRGFAGGNNQGLAEAAGKYLLLLNPDVVVEPGSLAALVDFLESSPQDTGIVGPRTLDGSGAVALTARGSYQPFSLLWQHIGLDRLFPYHVYGQYRRASEHATEPFEVAWVQGCCLMLRREVYEKIGGLDEGFFLFSEEPDFCDRAARAGWKTYFLPTSTIHHLESNSVSRYPEQKIRHYHISPMYYFRKRGQTGQVWFLKLGFTVELVLKAGVRAFQGLRGHEAGARLPIYGKILREVWRY